MSLVIRPSFFLPLRRATLRPILAAEKNVNYLDCQVQNLRSNEQDFLTFGGSFLDADRGSLLKAD